MGISVEKLSELTLFAGLGRDALQEIVPSVSQRECAPGEVIALEGDPCRAVHLVVKGVVRAQQLSAEGREYVLAYITAGECLDLGPALEEADNPATLEAFSATTLYVIPSDAFRTLMRRHGALSVAAATYLAAEVRRLSLLAKDLALRSVRARLARFLLAHAQGAPGQERWTQEMIASRIGTIRDVVGRCLRAFADEGLIRRERGRLVVVDQEALQREAGM